MKMLIGIEKLEGDLKLMKWGQDEINAILAAVKADTEHIETIGEFDYHEWELMPKCQYDVDCYYKVGSLCRFYDWDPSPERMECSYIIERERPELTFEENVELHQAAIEELSEQLKALYNVEGQEERRHELRHYIKERKKELMALLETEQEGQE